MSRSQPRKIVCPQCEEEADWEHWTSVNSSLHPELKQQLVAGELLTFECHDCGHSAMVEASVLYHDMNLRVMIWLMYPDEGGDLSVDSSTKALSEGMEGYQFRVVDNFGALHERIRVFDDGHDDLTIEAFKILLGLRRTVDIKNILVYDHSEGGVNTGRTIVMAEFGEGEPTRRAVAMDEVFDAAQDLADVMRGTLKERQGDWLYFDRYSLLADLVASGCFD